MFATTKSRKVEEPGTASARVGIRGCQPTIGPWLVHRFDVVGSTNDLAKELAPAGDAWLLVTADEQTAGRGQYGRKWHAPRGTNILATFSLPAADVAAPRLVSLAASVAVCEVLEEQGIPARCKWPNDVMISRAKIAGILTETHGARLCVGMGVNVGWPDSRSVMEDGNAWTSVKAELGMFVPRDRVLERLARTVAKWLKAAGQTILDGYRAHWQPRAGEVEILVYGSWRRGCPTGVSDDGSLRIRLPDGQCTSIQSSARVRPLRLQG